MAPLDKRRPTVGGDLRVVEHYVAGMSPSSRAVTVCPLAPSENAVFRELRRQGAVDHRIAYSTPTP